MSIRGLEAHIQTHSSDQVNPSWFINYPIRDLLSWHEQQHHRFPDFILCQHKHRR